MGKIIVIEGTDGSGKQTQAKKLCERLKAEGFNVIQTSFPNYESPSSSPVKMYLGGELSQNAKEIDAYQSSVLFAVDRLCTMISLKEFYEKGGIIILDRYVQSNMIHQAGKIYDLEERDEYLEWLNELEFDKLKLPKADLVVFLDVPTNVSQKLAMGRKELKNGKAKDIHESDKNHLQDAYNAGKYVSQKYNWTEIDCVDAEGNLKSIDEIHQQIYNQVKERVISNSRSL